jgi:hypothetical protein
MTLIDLLSVLRADLYKLKSTLTTKSLCAQDEARKTKAIKNFFNIKRYN